MYREKDYLVRKPSLEKFSWYYYISSKVFFGVAVYFKWRNKRPTSIYICIGLVNVVLWLKILGNRLGILTSVLIEMDYFSDVRKVHSNYEITNAYVK